MDNQTQTQVVDAMTRVLRRDHGRREELDRLERITRDMPPGAFRNQGLLETTGEVVGFVRDGVRLVSELAGLLRGWRR